VLDLLKDKASRHESEMMLR